MPSVVARGEFAAGFAVPSYMAFEDRLAGFDIKFVAPKTAWITPEPIGDTRGLRAPAGGARVHRVHALRARPARRDGAGRVSDHAEIPRAGQARARDAEMAVEFTGGMRSYFDVDVTNIYDDDKAQARYEQVNEQFRKDIESVGEELKKKY